MKKLLTVIIMLTAAVLLLCACTPDRRPCSPRRHNPGQTEQATPSGREFFIR